MFVDQLFLVFISLAADCVCALHWSTGAPVVGGCSSLCLVNCVVLSGGRLEQKAELSLCFLVVDEQTVSFVLCADSGCFLFQCGREHAKAVLDA